MRKCSGYHPVSESQFCQKVDIAPFCCQPSLCVLSSPNPSGQIGCNSSVCLLSGIIATLFFCRQPQSTLVCSRTICEWQPLKKCAVDWVATRQRALAATVPSCSLYGRLITFSDRDENNETCSRAQLEMRQFKTKIRVDSVRPSCDSGLCSIPVFKFKLKNSQHFYVS